MDHNYGKRIKLDLFCMINRFLRALLSRRLTMLAEIRFYSDRGKAEWQRPIDSVFFTAMVIWRLVISRESEWIYKLRLVFSSVRRNFIFEFKYQFNIIIIGLDNFSLSYTATPFVFACYCLISDILITRLSSFDITEVTTKANSQYNLQSHTISASEIITKH